MNTATSSPSSASTVVGQNGLGSGLNGDAGDFELDRNEHRSPEIDNSDDDNTTGSEPDNPSPNNNQPPTFNPTNCLFCTHASTTLDSNLIHMSRLHSLQLPSPHLLLVDIETLLSYLHLLISSYFECITCGTQRSSAQAVQQHMLGKGHCNIDISATDSEFRDFYDVADELDERVQVDESSLRLSSGKLVSKRSAVPAVRLRGEATTADASQSETLPATSSQALTKLEARDLALMNRLERLSEQDRRSLIHLPSSQQRAVLATQKKQVDRSRRVERAMLARVQGKGNKALMKHFVPDTPGRSNG